MKTEGYLKKYKGFIKGYKQVYLKIRGAYLVIQKKERNKEGRVKVDLRDEISVEPYNKDACDLVITYT
jgi:hypothetical protein